MHSWDDNQDCLLWHKHDEVKKIKEYRVGPELRDVGWNYLQHSFSVHDRHLVPIDFLKGRIRELGLDKEGIVEPGIGRSMLDIDHCILYCYWSPDKDQHILDCYKMLLQSPEHGKDKDFLNGEEWQQIQLEFQLCFRCCPTQTQLKTRDIKALKEMSYIDPSYVTTMAIVVLFLIIIIAIILYLFRLRSTAPPLLQLTLRTWSNYAEAIRQDPRAASSDCCSIGLVDYNVEEEGEDNPLRLLPYCGHVFHARCLDLWLQQRPTCPTFRSLVSLG
ncbi:hypothetical protein IEQ34_011095 [Dendrobium chrysotoxum]|uniref:RING-type domain-containing protein n=1 Tax=Dendrobium chrysotoxum TaxID=161865 RepID=A0AAV7GWS0_DENCH|nr:hypothetical protein IEQ34_011095 [Dendrobium chrysotoxum]